jgi:predicted ATPase
MKIIIENIRTFVGPHEISLRPLTILLGENSTGKSTFLACLSTITSPVGYPLDPKFNEPPYNLGGFDSIASKGGVGGRARSFSLGLVQDQSSVGKVTSFAKYLNRKGRIQLSEFEFNTPAGYARLKVGEVGGNYSGEVLLKDQEVPVEFAFEPRETTRSPSDFLDQFFIQFLQHNLKQIADGESLEKISKLFQYRSHVDTLSIAPIRTKPERTYDPSSEHSNPEGTHIPHVLARAIWGQKSSKEQKELIPSLERFGEESGLFTKVSVRNLGKRGSAPFQILVNIAGKSINLLDVGYGVSQSLPVVVESALAPAGKLLLIQQPEVHLHPRAQAALGSFFVSLVTGGEKQFVIETHSDYVVDRIRQEVAKGEGLSHDSVLILYFERNGLETTVYPLYLDKLGNILDAPPNYREFFLREEINLLSRSEIDQ